MYTKEDFNKDFEQIKETLKNIDYSKLRNDGRESIKLATEEFKNLYSKITDLLVNNQITKEEFNEYKNTLFEYFKSFDSEELLKSINDGIENILVGAKEVFSTVKESISNIFNK